MVRAADAAGDESSRAWKPPLWLTQQVGPYPQVTAEARWRQRPLASALVRYAAVATPIAASVLAAFLLGRLLPAPDTGARLVGAEDPGQGLADPSEPGKAEKKSSPRRDRPLVPPTDLRLPRPPKPLPNVDLPPIGIPGVDLPPTGTPIDDILP